VGGDPSYVQYRLLCLSTEIADWQQCFEESAYPVVLNWTLLDSVSNNLSTQHLTFLISNSANVNYSRPTWYAGPDTPLRLVVEAGNVENVRLLLNYGANILLETDPSGPSLKYISKLDYIGTTPLVQFKRISEIAISCSHLELAGMLEKIENEEVAKRNICISPITGELSHYTSESTLTFYSYRDAI
jgi:hypothetical protein